MRPDPPSSDPRPVPAVSAGWLAAVPTTSTSRADRSGAPGYQELLYEAGRYEVAAGLNVDVASPEDIEFYEHVRRTGAAPEMRISRATPRELEHH